MREEIPEYVLCSAVWYKDLELKKPEILAIRGISPYNVDRGIVFSGWRHGNCIYQMCAITGLRSIPAHVGEEVQGFLSSRNRFLTREEAAELALERGQIDKPKRILFSEDVW